MTIVFECGNPGGTPLSCLCFSATHHLHSLCDGMGCHFLQYTVTPIIDPWYHDSTAVSPWHLATTCAATHTTTPRSHFSTRQYSASHGKGVTRLSPYCYYPSLACPIPRFLSKRVYLGSYGTASWTSHELE
ncbi:hypothetical protein TNCV_4279141 [Trichonephila clavipes]|nr:hypothetical protein TNCV_4279141 [Trichonephila clavipes]